MIRVTYELEPPGSGDALARAMSVGLPDGPEFVRGHVLADEDGRAVLEFPETNWDADVTMLVSGLLAGEWADTAQFRRCRLVAAEWPAGAFPGPALGAGEGVLVGAIVKPSLGLRPPEVAETAAALARGGADLIKDDELLGDPEWCPLEDRVRRVVDAIPENVVYAVNVSGPLDSLLARAHRAIELGAGALMLNAFAQGLDAVRVLRNAELGVPIFVHRVGAALWSRNGTVGVAGPVVAELTRLVGADFVQAGSFTGKLYDRAEDVHGQIAACHRPLAAVRPATAVLGGGVGPMNAAEEVALSGVTAGIMVLLGSAAYAHEGGAEEGVRATVEALSGWM